MGTSVYDTAFAAVEHGISVVPIRADGTKQPMLQWGFLQERRPTTEEVEGWFAPPSPAGLAVICGAISGGLECLEFEAYRYYKAFRELAYRNGHDVLISRLDGGYSERSPRGGIHWLYRCEEVSGAVRLASVASKRPDTDWEVAIETRGEGNYVIIAPSGGRVHNSGRPYELLNGGFDTIPVLSAGERRELFAMARHFDEKPKSAFVERAPTSGHRVGRRPGDEWAAQTSWKEILEPHEWAYAGAERDGATLWRRPGKQSGVSAATGWSEADTLKVYSTSTVFDTETTYSKFAAWTLLNFDGDFGAATQELVRRGFGQQEVSEGRIIVPAPPGFGGGTKELPTKPSDYPQTDQGNAELLADAFGDEWVYNYQLKKWMQWQGHWWAHDTTRVIEERAVEVARMRFDFAEEIEDEERREKIQKFARRSENDRGIKAMLSRAQAVKALKDPGVGWDSDPYLLGVENGVVDILEGTLRDGHRADHITQHLPIKYDPKADCPRFQQFLYEIMGGDVSLQNFLWRALGYTLTADVREQCLFMCYGKGSNGKSTLLHLMQRLLGDDPATGYARTLSSKALQQRHGPSSHDETISVIVGKRLVTSAELSVRAIDTERLKALAGGDIINTRRLFLEPFDFRPVCKLWLSFNSRPQVHDDSHGFWRKVHLVPFTQQFDRYAEPDLEEKLLAERPGILNFLLDGAREWHRDGLQTPAAVTAATQDYREEADLLNLFISDCVVRVPGETMRAADLFRVYKTWSLDQGLSQRETLTSTAFGRRMTERFTKKRTRSGNVYEGIQIRSNQTPIEEDLV